MRTASSKNTGKAPAPAEDQPLAKPSHFLRSASVTYNRLDSRLKNLPSINLPTNSSVQAVVLPPSLF